MQDPRITDVPREIEIPGLAYVVALLAIPAFLWNRLLLPALPGSHAGLERIFDRLSLVGSVLSQLLALTLSWLIIKLVVSCLGTFTATSVGRSTGRLLSLPIGSAVGFLLVASTIGPLDPEMHLLLSGLGTAALISSLSSSLRNPTSRAAGLLVLLCAVGSLAFSLGRLLALKASVEALPREYAAARLLSTGGLIFDFLALTWVSVWLLLSTGTQANLTTSATASTVPTARRTAPLWVLGAVALAACAAWISSRGQSSTANFAEVVLGRAFAALARQPSPFGHARVGPTLDVLAVLFAGILLVLPRPASRVARSEQPGGVGATPEPGRAGTQVGVTRVAMALVLLGRCAPDIPAHAALMTAGALLLIFHAPQFRLAQPSQLGRRAPALPSQPNA